jgi:hypothetical protein
MISVECWVLVLTAVVLDVIASTDLSGRSNLIQFENLKI